MKSLAAVIASSGERVVIVHGGGSFGHPLAKRFHLSSSAVHSSSVGVSETRQRDVRPQRQGLRLASLRGPASVHIRAVPPADRGGKQGHRLAQSDLLDAGLTPVTFGDVVQGPGGFTIISGDTISRVLSRSLGAARCIFVMDVDGMLGSDGEPMPSIDGAYARGLPRRASSDATGGIAMKVVESLRMAASGTEVAFVSGFRSRELAKALKRLSFHGTIVRVPSRD